MLLVSSGRNGSSGFGYLTESYSLDDLEWILNLSDSDYKKVAVNARDTVLAKFDSKIIAQQYIDLYQSLLAKN